MDIVFLYLQILTTSKGNCITNFARKDWESLVIDKA